VFLGSDYVMLATRRGARVNVRILVGPFRNRFASLRAIEATKKTS